VLVIGGGAVGAEVVIAAPAGGGSSKLLRGLGGAEGFLVRTSECVNLCWESVCVGGAWGPFCVRVKRLDLFFPYAPPPGNARFVKLSRVGKLADGLGPET
jgi:hypothetical protein